MVFDFRFWVGQPTVVDGRIIVRSGLLTSASRDVRFTLAKERSLEDRREVDNATPTWSARGNVTGHPCNDPGIEWFLDETSGKIQWGFLPNLWPQGSVRRLDNWGWQIENPNVVLRSIDPSPPLTTAESCDWDETKLDEIESDCSRNHGRLDPNKDLWKDLLDSLVNIPLRTAPSVNGFRVTAEIPRSFSQYYE